jgi:uncharacterized protein YdhG (YjbR/CyaY superfamily)
MEPVSKTKFKTVDEYLSTFPNATQLKLQQVRAIIKKYAPLAKELISYNMPAFSYNGILVYYAGYKNHVGFYPTASGIAAFKKELTSYEWAKGSVQFPLDKPIPEGLIGKIVKFRVKENEKRLELKGKKTNTH